MALSQRDSVEKVVEARMWALVPVFLLAKTSLTAGQP